MIIIIIITIITIIFLLSIYLFIHSFTYLFFSYTVMLVGFTPSIIVLYNGGSKAPIRLSGRGKSCLFYTKCGMFGLGIVPKEIHSCLFNPGSN